MLREPEEIKRYQNEVISLREAGEDERADRSEKYLAEKLLFPYYRLVISGEDLWRHDNHTPQYPFFPQYIIIAVPEGEPKFRSKKGLIIQGAPIKLWDRENLSWREFPAGMGSSK